MKPEPFSAEAIDAVLRPHYIGAKMSTVEYRAALAKIGAAVQARIDLPEANASYAGKIVQWSDTHIVQRVGAHRAVAHDVGKLANGKEILQSAAEGNTTGVRIVYDQLSGSGAVQPFSTQHAREIVDAGTQWAARHIVSAVSQVAFVERITAIGRARQTQYKTSSQVTPPVTPALQPRMVGR